ncbi:ribosomal protein S8-domain-containing protein, partial [Parachaetomium inaequale]
SPVQQPSPPIPDHPPYEGDTDQHPPEAVASNTIKMGVHSVTNACIHLQNATRAHLGLTSIPNTKYNLRLALALHRAGLISSVTRGGPRPPPPEALLATETEPVTSENVATRRLWVGLKYWDNKPVVRNVSPVSKPSRLVTATLPELAKVARGFPVGQLKGLNLGETLFLSTDRGVLEVREALERKVGGLVLCRVS